MIDGLKPYPAMKDSGVPWLGAVPGSAKTGYEISFTRYFYQPQPLRTLEEIRADILALEKETEGLLGVVIGEDEEDGQ